jgi:hypothetical protein
MKWNQIFLAFLIGLLMGTFAGPFLFHRVMHRHWDRQHRHDRLLKKFSSKLKLSPDQREKISQILDANRPKVDAIFTETRTKLETVRQDTGLEIKKILSADQQKKYDELDIKMKERMDRNFPPPLPSDHQ